MRLILLSLFLATPAFAAGDGLSWATIGFHAANLALLLFIIVKLTRAKVQVALEARADGVSGEIAEATRLHAEARSLLDQYEEKISGLEAEVAEIKSSYKAQGEAERDRLIADATKEADRIRRDAERAAENEFSRQRVRLEAEVVSKAISAAEAAIREKMTPADQRRLTAEYLSRLEDVARA